jgi:hypothetical protein
MDVKGVINHNPRVYRCLRLEIEISMRFDGWTDVAS